MSRSPAQIAAARANGAKSRGPVTPEGKVISRRNSYKHGMASNGIVINPLDTAEVTRRSDALHRQLAPATELGSFYVDRIAELTVRVQRCSRNDRADIEFRVAHAEEAFDEARLADVDHTISWIGQEPATYSRKLRSMPEGIDRMIAEFLKLHAELNTGRWNWFHGEKVSQLMGDRWMEIPVTRVRAVSEAINGKFDYLNPDDGAGLSKDDRIDWARDTMGALIEDEIEALLEHRKNLDYESIELDRSTAADRAISNPSKEAILARRYEAAAERGIYKALNALRQVEAEAAAMAPPEEAAPEAPGSIGEEPEVKQEEASEGDFQPRPRPPGQWTPVHNEDPKAPEMAPSGSNHHRQPRSDRKSRESRIEMTPAEPGPGAFVGWGCRARA